MNNKWKSVFLLALLITQFTVFVTMSFQTPLDRESDTLTVNESSNFDNAELDLDRVEWQTNRFENPSFENWNNPNNPTSISTSRSIEQGVEYSTDNPHNGARSGKMEVRAMSENNYAQARLTQTSFPGSATAENLTLEFYYYIENIEQPTDSDFLMLDVYMDSKHMYYYLGSEITATNGTYSCYFMISTTEQVWNLFNRNLSLDYFEAFAENPVIFQTFNFYLRSYTFEYSTVYIDDLWLVNGTTIRIGESLHFGDFETGGTDWGWYMTSVTDPGDISQSDVAIDGDWSLNMTVLSYGRSSYCSFTSDINSRVTDLNQDQFSFSWRVDEWINGSTASTSYSYMSVEFENATDDGFTIVYMLSQGGGSPPFSPDANTLVFNATNFNTTNQWNYFDRSFWQDFNENNATSEMYISDIKFRASANGLDHRFSLLVDNASFISSSINGMDFEDQPAVGSMVRGLSSGMVDSLTVTDFSVSGTKAANLTIEDETEVYLEQSLHRPLSNTIELILEISWFLEHFNNTSEDYLYIDVSTGAGSISYIIANGTALESFVSDEEYIIIISDANIIGSWNTLRIDIIHDYERLIGTFSEEILWHISIIAATQLDSKMTVFFDDLYMYEDSAPDISDIEQSIALPVEGDAVDISAVIIDATLDTALLHYRVDSGDWNNLTMTHQTDDIFEATIPEQSLNAHVEYFVSANDTFSRRTVELDGTEYFEYTVEAGSDTTSTTTDDTQPDIPEFDIFPLLVIVGVIGAIAVVVIIIFISKKKE